MLQWLKMECWSLLYFLQFHIPDLRVGTLDSLLALSDDLTKVRDSLLAHRASLRSVAFWNRCRVCWRNFGFCTIPPSRFFAASSGILGLWRWLLCRRIRSWREWHTRWRGRLTSWSEWPLQIQALLLWMVFLSILMSPGESGKPNQFLLLISSDLKNSSQLWVWNSK
jgi:hypothetical protein